MRIAIIGAHGFIGSHVARAFLAAGHDVVGLGRDPELGSRLLPDVAWLDCDLNKDTEADLWQSRLMGCDVLVNCAGVLQRTSRDDPHVIHGEATIAAFEGAKSAGLGRIIHLSALGADDDVDTDYSRSKRVADRHLEGMNVDWIILKPSLVIARECYGGTRMVRMLAGLPIVAPLPRRANAQFQPVAMHDLVAGIVALAEPSAPARITMAVTGPDQMRVSDLITRIRSWLGLPPIRVLTLPDYTLAPAVLAADVLGFFGVETAMRSTSFRQTEKPNIADRKPFERATGLHMRSIDEALKHDPASHADRMHARLLAPLLALRWILVLFWCLTGVLTIAALGDAVETAPATRLAGIAGPTVTLAAILGGAAADLLLGIWLAVARDVRKPCLAQIGLMIVYIVGLSYLSPSLWADPLGVLLKILPIIGATLVLMMSGVRR